MASGLPCVSTRLAGVPEMVRDGFTGLLTDERAPDAFADALATLLSDRELCHQMGRAGHERAARMFAKEITARDLMRCLAAFGKLRLAFVTFIRRLIMGAFCKTEPGQIA